MVILEHEIIGNVLLVSQTVVVFPLQEQLKQIHQAQVQSLESQIISLRSVSLKMISYFS